LICFLPRYAVLPPAIPTREDVLPIWDSSADENGGFNNSSPTGGASTNKGQTSATLFDTNGSGGLANGEKAEIGTMPRKGSSKRNTIFDPEQILPVVASDQPLQAARNPPKATFWDYFGFLSFLRPIIRLLRGRATRDLTAIGRVKKQENVESNVPLEITLFLNSYLAWLLNNGSVAPAIASGFVTNISTLQDTFNNLERIRNTPLPFAYQTHLRLSLWWVTFAVESFGVKYELIMYRSDRLYLLFLPFQIYSAFKYLTIPYVYCHRVV
jgi:ion channel-forming bestrophin family protein